MAVALILVGHSFNTNSGESEAGGFLWDRGQSSLCRKYQTSQNIKWGTVSKPGTYEQNNDQQSDSLITCLTLPKSCWFGLSKTWECILYILLLFNSQNYG